MEQEQDFQESLNPDEETVQESKTEGEEKMVKKSAYENQKIRAEKAEALAKELKEKLEAAKPPEKTPEKNLEYTLQDIRALSDIHDEDVDWLTNYAKFNNVKIAEAKKRKDVQVYLNLRQEERRTAEVSNTGGTARSSSQVSDEDLLDKVARGELPEEDIERAAQARLAKMKGLKK